MRRWLYEHSLLVVIGALALLSLVGQSATGWSTYNDELAELGRAPLSLPDYLASGHWLEATFENWESEFLQMGMYVVLSVWLRQRGSAESKGFDGDDDVDREPMPARRGAPWPVRRGGWVLAIYKRSLSLAFFILFAVSIWLHAVGGAEVESIERVAHGEAPVSAAAYMTSAKFWFESLQNWQSEFVSIFAIVALTVVLRQQGSPQSKPVDEPHATTGA